MSYFRGKNFANWDDWSVGETKHGGLLKWYICFKKVWINVIFYPKGSLFITWGNEKLSHNLKHNGGMSEELFNQIVDLLLDFQSTSNNDDEPKAYEDMKPHEQLVEIGKRKDKMYEKEKRICLECKKPLVTIGLDRRKGKVTHNDWDTRQYHKKCWLKKVTPNFEQCEVCDFKNKLNYLYCENCGHEVCCGCKPSSSGYALTCKKRLDDEQEENSNDDEAEEYDAEEYDRLSKEFDKLLGLN